MIDFISNFCGAIKDAFHELERMKLELGTLKGESLSLSPKPSKVSHDGLRNASRWTIMVSIIDRASLCLF